MVHAQELYAKAALVDYDALASAQARCQLVEAESMLRDAYSTDVRPAIKEWRAGKRLSSWARGALPVAIDLRSAD